MMWSEEEIRELKEKIDRRIEGDMKVHFMENIVLKNISIVLDGILQDRCKGFLETQTKSVESHLLYSREGELSEETKAK